jgi:hypothetical protein
MKFPIPPIALNHTRRQNVASATARRSPMADQDKHREHKKKAGQGKTGANLGQKDAQQQQHSDSELAQMGEQSGGHERDKGKPQSE